MGLIDQFRVQASCRELQKRTIGTYEFWIRKFFNETGRKAASEWNGAMVSQWLHGLDRQNYSSISRKQALCALVFVFRHVLKADLPNLGLPKPPREKFHLRTIPSREELARIFAGLKGQPRLMAALMYGAGLRVEETCKLRVKDIDFDALTIGIHGGKGDKDRLCLMPVVLVPHLQRQIAWRAALHDQDLAAGAGVVELPGRLTIKYKNASRDLGWQYLFPSQCIQNQRRWHAVPEGVQKAMRGAVKAAGITKRVTPHTLRHAFATHALRAGNDIRTIQDPTPVLEAMGTQLVSLTKRAFNDSALRAASWPPKKDGSASRLKRTGALYQSIAIVQLTSKEVHVGSDRPYAATHQFGSAKRNIPARPFFPFLSGRMIPSASEKIEATARRKIAALLPK